VHFGLAVSIVLHLGVLAWALITIQTTPPFKLAESEPVEVALVSPDALVRLKQGDREAKQLEAQPKEGTTTEPPKKEAPMPKTQAAPPPPPAGESPPPEAARPEPPKPDLATLPEPLKIEPQKDRIAEKLAALPPQVAPEPGPTLDEKKVLEEKLALERKAEEARKQAEARKKADEEKKRKLTEAKKKAAEEKKRKEAEAKKKQFDAQRIAALLNKVPDKSAPPTGAPTPPIVPTKAKGPVAGAPEGSDSQLTANQRSLLGAMMKRAVGRCWNVNSGLEGADKVVVEVEVRLRPDGRLLHEPRIINSSLGPLFADAANSAVRALVQCEPYDLPRDLYEGGWDHMVVTFDPQRMF
jgi:colicin import membrane protein